MEAEVLSKAGLRTRNSYIANRKVLPWPELPQSVENYPVVRKPMCQWISKSRTAYAEAACSMTG